MRVDAPHQPLKHHRLQLHTITQSVWVSTLKNQSYQVFTVQIMGSIIKLQPHVYESYVYTIVLSVMCDQDPRAPCAITRTIFKGSKTPTIHKGFIKNPNQHKTVPNQYVIFKIPSLPSVCGSKGFFKFFFYHGQVFMGFLFIPRACSRVP